MKYITVRCELRKDHGIEKLLKLDRLLRNIFSLLNADTEPLKSRIVTNNEGWHITFLISPRIWEAYEVRLSQEHGKLAVKVKKVGRNISEMKAVRRMKRLINRANEIPYCVAWIGRTMFDSVPG